MSLRRLLAAFDFDHTIVEENSDIVARKLINSDLIPEQTKNLYLTDGWIEYMSQIFKLLYKNNVNQKMIVEAMKRMSPTPNMLELLNWLRDEGCELIIISDSNSVFIKEWLKHKNLLDCFQRVFTNPASFEDSGLLMIQPYHSQDWCQLSTRNLCKGHILETYIKERLDNGVKFDTVAYIGDGQNDFCPSLRLKEHDIVFPRKGFPLEDKITSVSEGNQVVAQVYPWNSALDIKKHLEKLVL